MDEKLVTKIEEILNVVVNFFKQVIAFFDGLMGEEGTTGDEGTTV